MQPYTLDDAEAELRAAVDADDHDGIARLEAVVDRLDVKPPAVTLHSAALWYASVGLHVFPLQPGGKIPFKGSNGCKDGTTDTDRINRWWEGNPHANIGIATGFVVDVVDIDGHPGQRSRVARWDDVFASIDADSVAKVLTPRVGGMHIYVPAQGDGNAAGIFPGIDYRGLGGYVVAPPSVVTDGPNPGRYRFLGTPSLAAVRVAA